MQASHYQRKHTLWCQCVCGYVLKDLKVLYLKQWKLCFVQLQSKLWHRFVFKLHKITQLSFVLLHGRLIIQITSFHAPSTNFTWHQVRSNWVCVIKSIWKRMTVWNSIFTRYRQCPASKSLQNQVHNWLKFREIQRVKLSKSAILPTLFGCYVICEIDL